MRVYKNLQFVAGLAIIILLVGLSECALSIVLSIGFINYFVSGKQSIAEVQ